MGSLDELVEANARVGEGTSLGAPPSRQVAVVTCMDARIDVHAAFGVAPGEVHVMRNAGGVVTDDVLRSLAISQRKLGTRAVMVVHHTGCGMIGLDDTAFAAELEADAGQAPAWVARGFPDLEADVADGVRRVRDCPFLPHRDDVRGFVLDLGTGRLAEVDVPAG